MKSSLIPVFGFTLLSSLVVLQGAEHPGPYARVDVGGTIQQDLKIRTIEGVTAPGSKFKFDPGARFDFAGGYNFNESLAVELEFGMTYNEVDDVVLFGTSLPKPREIGFFGPTTREGHLGLHYYQVPIMANVIYTVPLSSRLKPFIGVGAGGIASVFEGERDHHRYYYDDDYDWDDDDSFGHDSAFTFGYQGQAGLTFMLAEHMEIGVVYKFMGALPQRYSFDFGEVQTDNTYSHSILVGFSFVF